MPIDTRRCGQCGREGTRGFSPIRGLDYPGHTWFVCTNKNACRKRWPKRLEVDE